MKERSKNNSVATNIKNGFEFTIENNHQIFDLIINKLYSNKIGAVVRELGANAVDSHREAGHTKSFDIHLPTRLEPFFYIRDYGVGLTPEEIRNLYTRLGASSKRDTDDQIGCFGIGSKSPFAYTSSFTVISYKDGEKHTYQAYISQSKKPEVAILQEKVKTDEPNGLKVQIDVNNSMDYQKFIKEMQQYVFFPIKPNFVGYNNITLAEPKYITRTDRYGIKNEVIDPYGYSFNKDISCRVIMGGVLYKYTPQGLSWLEQYGVDLFLDIGEVNIAGSREEVEYDEYTLKNLGSRLSEIEKSIEVEVQADIDKQKNWFEAYKFYKTHPIAPKFRLKYKGKDLKTGDLDLPDLGKSKAIKFRSYGRARQELFIKINGSEQFIENDLKVGAISRCNEIRSQRPILFFWEDPKDKKKFMQEIGIDDSYFTKASSLAKPQKQASNRQTVSGGTYEIDLNYCKDHNRTYQALTELQVPIPDGSYYVILDRQKPSWKTYRLEFPIVKTICDLMGVTKVYGINKSVSAKVLKKLKKSKDLFKEFDGYKSKLDYNLTRDPINHYEQRILKNAKCFTNKHLEKLIEHIKERDKESKLNEQRRNLCKLTKYFTITNGKENDLKSSTDLEFVKTKYPLLIDYIDNYDIPKQKQTHLQKYLDCIGE